jgi:hypothetical protein
MTLTLLTCTHPHRELLTRAVPYGDQSFLHVVTEVLKVRYDEWRM